MTAPTASQFLSGVQLRNATLPEDSPFQLRGLALGQAQADRAGSPRGDTGRSTRSAQRAASLWKKYLSRRRVPLLLAVVQGDHVTLCGPTGEDPPVYPDLGASQADRVCRAALSQPDRHAALRYLRNALRAVSESRLPGVRNEGFLATHTLAATRTSDSGWAEANKKARPHLARRDDALLRALGYRIEAGKPPVTSVLRAGPKDARMAVAVLLRPEESPDDEAVRFNGLSPVSYGMAVADRENLPYVVVVQGGRLRLYPVKMGVGVGRRGRTDTFLEVHADLLGDDAAAYLWLLFSGEALTEGGSLDRLLHDSEKYAGDLAERLRERVYGEVVPLLARSIAEARAQEADREGPGRDLRDGHDGPLSPALHRLRRGQGPAALRVQWPLPAPLAQDSRASWSSWSGPARRSTTATRSGRRSSSSFVPWKKAIGSGAFQPMAAVYSRATRTCPPPAAS